MVEDPGPDENVIDDVRLPVAGSNPEVCNDEPPLGRAWDWMVCVAPPGYCTVLDCPSGNCSLGAVPWPMGAKGWKGWNDGKA